MSEAFWVGSRACVRTHALDVGGHGPSFSFLFLLLLGSPALCSGVACEIWNLLAFEDIAELTRGHAAIAAGIEQSEHASQLLLPWPSVGLAQDLLELP